ncbi:SLBB domain-containing protein [bacterium]|nr:SLBB domain-containing protein [bacterium]
MALLLVTALPLSAVDKNPKRAENTPQVVNVGGQVARVGPIEYREATTIFAMIMAAGGPTEFGTLKRVKVVRDGRLIQLDLTQEKLRNELVKPNDTIEIPQKKLLGR